MAYEMYIEDILFPVTPKKMTMGIKNNNETVVLINEGEVNLPKKAGLTDIEIDELILPMQECPYANYGADGFKLPEYYLEFLEKWKNDMKPVKFKLVRLSPNGSVLMSDTNMSVTVEDYKILEDAENYGTDICVKLTLKQYKEWGAKKLKTTKKKKKNYDVLVVRIRKKKNAADTYTVKGNETLLNIAKKQLGDASKKNKIYSLNKKVIEDAAKKHGRKSSSNGMYLYKGTKLKLPKK